MNAPTRLTLFGFGLAAVFGAALLVGRYVVPDDASTTPTDHSSHSSSGNPGAHGDDHTAAAVGTSKTADGYALVGLHGPERLDQDTPLTFTIAGTNGEALTRFTPAHDKELHLIIVRFDGAHFAHVHPTRDTAGIWSTSWRAPAAGTYRVFADFVPGDRDGDASVVLASTVEVAGQFEPIIPAPNRTATVDSFTVVLDGDLTSHGSSTLTARVRRDGRDVALQPYLGASGHLVLLRGGDLAYTHVHPMHGNASHSNTAHDSSHQDASDVAFGTQAPSTGRYLAYFDFQIDGVVRTASFVLDTAH